MNYTCTSIRPQEHFLYVPDNFNPKKVLSPHLRRYSDHACHTIDRIITTPICDRRIEDGYVPINAACERRFYPNNPSYSLVKGDMLDSGAIECDGVYIQGEKSFGHRMGEAYRNRPARQVAVADPLLIKKIAADRQRRVLALDPTCRSLYDKLRMLRIDHRAAKAALVRDAAGWASHNLAIDMLHDGRLFAVRCKYGRLHTSLTNFPSDLRRYLTAQGKHLVGLDFKNFQPTLFWFLAKRRYGSRPMPPDAGRYLNDCLSGNLYEKLAGKEKFRDEDERRKFKPFVFYVMYGPDGYKGLVLKVARQFARLYPSVYAILQAWKAETGDYRVVSWALQKAESDFMIGRVAPVLLERFPRKFIGTIHDCLMVTADMEADVRAILEEEAHKHFGANLPVKPTHYAPPSKMACSQS